MTYFTSRFAKLEKGCGKERYEGIIYVVTCDKKDLCPVCRAKIQQLKEDEEEVRKAIKKCETHNFSSIMPKKTAEFYKNIFYLDIEELKEELGIKTGDING